MIFALWVAINLDIAHMQYLQAIINLEIAKMHHLQANINIKITTMHWLLANIKLEVTPVQPQIPENAALSRNACQNCTKPSLNWSKSLREDIWVSGGLRTMLQGMVPV